MPLEKQETVKFDATKKAHREAAAAFLVRRAWNDCPLRFSHDPTYGSVADQIEKKMLAFYMSKDRLVIPKPRNPAVLVGTIVDGIAPKGNIQLLTDSDLAMPVPSGIIRVVVSANDERETANLKA